MQTCSNEIIEHNLKYCIEMNGCVMKNKIGKSVYSVSKKCLHMGYQWMARLLHVFYKQEEVEKEVEILPAPPENLPVPSPATLILDSESERLRKAIQRLNEVILLESDVFIVIQESDYSQTQLSPRSNIYFKEPVNRAVSLLRGDIRKIKERELKVTANHFLFQYETLSKYLIFIFSDSLNEAFAIFYNQIKQLVDEILLLEEEAIDAPVECSNLYPIFNDIFRSIESIRFVANKKNSFNKNLQEAARRSSKQLRKSLELTTLGKTFLNLHYRMNIKEKFNMRSRFKLL
jgi:hypothetical protein